jgi:predicted small integral membrane protein
MFDIKNTLRALKILLVAGVAAYFTFVVIDNVTYYRCNFEAVQHVLSMDTVIKDSPLKWRAVTDPFMQNFLYCVIISWEAATALLCWIGIAVLVKNFSKDDEVFSNAKKWATLGVGTGMMLWLFVFITVGGEWFQMWQSQSYNAQGIGSFLFCIDTLILLLLIQKEG